MFKILLSCVKDAALFATIITVPLFAMSWILMITARGISDVETLKLETVGMATLSICFWMLIVVFQLFDDFNFERARTHARNR
ncbi:MAG: hypothetical protein WCT54_01010 [Patescibacteria group bacterium]|jgi:hypothetical protein